MRGIRISALKDNEEIVEPLADRILGRVSVHDVVDPLNEEMIVEANEMIDEEKARQISETSIELVEIRSVLYMLKLKHDAEFVRCATVEILVAVTWSRKVRQLE